LVERYMETPPDAIAVVSFSQSTSFADCENFLTQVTPASVVLKIPGPLSLPETRSPPHRPTVASRKSLSYIPGQLGNPDLRVQVAPASVVLAVAPFDPMNPTVGETKSR